MPPASSLGNRPAPVMQRILCLYPIRAGEMARIARRLSRHRARRRPKKRLLVPERIFRRSVIGQRISLEWLARQKAYWRVSMAFLLYRLGALGILTRHQSEYLWKKISALGWRTREPHETDISTEKPTVFPGVVRYHSEQLGYDVDDLRRCSTRSRQSF